MTTIALGGCIDPALRAGRGALTSGQYALAISHFETAQGRLEDGSIVVAELASAHRAAAMQQLDHGACGEASSHLDAAEALTRPVIADRQALLECLESTHASDLELRPQMRHLLALGDSRARILRRLMHMALDAGHDAEATTYIAALDARFALTLEDHRRVAQSLIRLGRSQEAFPHLMHASRADPGDPITRLKLAELMALRGERGAARRAYNALAHDFRDNPVVFLRLAEFLRGIGDPKGAATAQAQADALRGVLRKRRRLRPLRKSKR